MNYSDLKPNCIVRGSILSEPVQVIAITDVGVNRRLAWSGATLGEWRVA